MGRAPCCDKANVKRGPWSPEEDAVLKQCIETHGIGGNWITLPHRAGLKRCGKSCRLRWLNYLRPDIKHGGFTAEEDNIISSLYFTLGTRWSIIASNLPGRTDNEVKNYWHTKLKKKLMAAGKILLLTPIDNSTICNSLTTKTTATDCSSIHHLPSLEVSEFLSSSCSSSDLSNASHVSTANKGQDLSIDSLLDLEFDVIYGLVSNGISFDQEGEVKKPIRDHVWLN